MDESPPANVGDIGLILGPGRLYLLPSNEACVPQVLSPRAAITGALSLEPVLCNKRSHHSEKPMHPNEEEPPVIKTREIPCKKKKKKTNEDPSQPK